MTTTISKNGFVIASIVSNSRNNKTVKQYGKSHEWGITNQITLSNGITIGPEGLETSDMTMNMPSRTTVFIDSGHGSSFINSGFPFGRGKVTCIDSFQVQPLSIVGNLLVVVVSQLPVFIRIHFQNISRLPSLLQPHPLLPPLLPLLLL